MRIIEIICIPLYFSCIFHALESLTRIMLVETLDPNVIFDYYGYGVEGRDNITAAIAAGELDRGYAHLFGDPESGKAEPRACG